MKTIVLQDVQALRGGQKLFLRSDGTGVCQVIAWNREAGGFYEKRYRLALSPVQLHPLLERVNAEAFQTISIQERPGLPDEARPTISLTLASGKALKISKWLGDKHQEFDAVYQNLLALVQSAKQTKPEVEGKYDRQWVPEGFSLP